MVLKLEILSNIRNFIDFFQYVSKKFIPNCKINRVGGCINRGLYVMRAARRKEKNADVVKRIIEVSVKG